jgi:fructose-specific component phosphotransferase system IIB-like protein
MVEVSNLRMQANTRLNSSQARMTRARARAARQAVAQITQELQEAGALVKQGDHVAAQPKLNGLKGRLEKLVASMSPTGAQRRVRTAPES